jgi:hypothetical protein
MSALKAPHTTVSEACPDDVGFVWWTEEWFPARIVQDDDDELFCVALTCDGSEWLPIGSDDGDPVGSMPWFQISAPPYDADEAKPITHMLTWTDADARWTFSWRMSAAEGNAISKKISWTLHEQLEVSKAEKLSDA